MRARDKHSSLFVNMAPRFYLDHRSTWFMLHSGEMKTKAKILGSGGTVNYAPIKFYDDAESGKGFSFRKEKL